MNKIYKVLFAILCMCAFSASVFADDTFRIQKVVVEGLQNVKEKAVLSEITTKKGKLYIPSIARDDLREILALEYFDDVELSIDKQNKIVKFKVTEKPYVSKIIFKGNKQFSKSKLKSEITLKEKKFYSFTALEESKSKILSMYADKGYPDCNLESYPTTDPATNKMTVTFLITENNKVLVGDLYVTNVKSFKTKKIRKLAKTKKKKVFKEETLKQDMATIVAFYKNHGFMDFSIKEPVIEYSQDRTKMFITIEIEEGPKYKIGGIYFEGNEVISDKELQHHRKYIKKDEVFNQEKIVEVLNLVYDDYSNRGYLHSYIAPDFTKNTLEQENEIYKNKASFEQTEMELILQSDIDDINKKLENTPDETMSEKEIKKLSKQNKKLEKKKIKLEKKLKKEQNKKEKLIEKEQKKQEKKLKEIEEYRAKEKEIEKDMSEIDNMIKSNTNVSTDETNNESNKNLQKQIKKLEKKKTKLQNKLAKIQRKIGVTSIVDVSFNIQENNIVYVGDVFVDGLTSTKDNTIRREILLKPGDVFSSKKVRRSMEKIYNLGFIDGAEPAIIPTNSPDYMDLGFSITEGKPGMITAGAGYSSVDKFVGSIQLQHMNLFGKAQKLNLLWEFGARRQNYEIDWTEPWFLNKKMSLGLSLFDIDRLRDYSSTEDAYRENRIGGSVSISPRVSDDISLLFAYTYEYVKLYDIDSEELRKLLESNPDLSKDRTSSIKAQIVYDTRDYIYDPSTGVRYSYAVTFAGGPFGGNVNYVKNNVRANWYFPTFWKFVLTVNLNLGVIENYGESTDVPLYEKYYIGGADTVRGYKYRTEVGPYNGGKVMAVANIEYKFPIVQEKRKTILQGAFFYDIGGSWKNIRDIRLRFGDDNRDPNSPDEAYYLKSGVGFGLRFATPVFPLRLDWAYGLNHKEGEDLQQFYFTVGNVF